MTTPDIDDFTDITDLILEAPINEMDRNGEVTWRVNLIHNDPDGPCPCHDNPDDQPCRAERRRRQRQASNVHIDFGYTDGLDAFPVAIDDPDLEEWERMWRDAGILRLPELHLPAYPLNEGEGWEGMNLDSASVGDILNRAAAVSILWKAPLTRTRWDLSCTRDNHRFWMRFIVAAPTNPGDVNANQVSAGASVTPIMWSVHHVDCLEHDTDMAH